MSPRPRFAGDGLLRRPAQVIVRSNPRAAAEGPAFVGHFEDDRYDPFGKVDSGLLLAEEFARADLRPGADALDWLARHGVLDTFHFLPPDPLRADWPVSAAAFCDLARDVEAHQRTVAWHLLSLARLSDQLAAAGGDWGRVSGEGWIPRFVQPAIRIGLDLLWLGGAEPYDRHIGHAMRETPEPIGEAGTPEMSDEDFRDWWRRAHASYRRIVAEDVPVLWMPRPERRFATWEAQAALDDPVEKALTTGIGTDPWSLVMLERRLMEPFITGAGEHAVSIGWPDEGSDGRGPGTPLVVRERRTWDSLLAPVYVQLLEGLRRVSEGQRGGAFCKECGQAFLTLDARRSSFCTDRERYRYGQRQHRRRAAAKDSLSLDDGATVEIERGDPAS